MVVEFLSALQRAAGEARVELTAATVGELLTVLTARYGEPFRRELMTPEGNVKAGIAILVNGRNIIFLQGMATPLNDWDKVTIIPPAGGG